MMKIPSILPDLLLPWYQKNKRDLPWRKDRDPYHIWISEIMLQQTRVEAVKGYYARFLDTLPTISALADCDDDLLHKRRECDGERFRALIVVHAVVDSGGDLARLER